MNYRDFKAAVAIEANEPRDYEQIIFRAPDGTIYNNVTVDFGYWNNSKDKAIIVNLFNIKPKFKVGDIVCNKSGLYPNVKYTIAEVNEELEYYGYKEVDGKTYFKDQDKLMLVDNIKPKFKVGDKVKGVSSEYPEKVFTINIVNTGNKCYHYFNSRGIITKFKDQDKLVLVNGEEVRPPVEATNKSNILSESYAWRVEINVLEYNIEHYPLIYDVLKQIIAISKEGAISYRLVVPMKKKADEAGVYYEEDEVCGIIRWHFDKLGYNIKENVNNKNNYVEFIISW